MPGSIRVDWIAWVEHSKTMNTAANTAQLTNIRYDHDGALFHADVEGDSEIGVMSCKLMGDMDFYWTLNGVIQGDERRPALIAAMREVWARS